MAVPLGALIVSSLFKHYQWTPLSLAGAGPVRDQRRVAAHAAARAARLTSALSQLSQVAGPRV
jgi:hypothetical protein